jgi:plasmid segregation protein ParM
MSTIIGIDHGHGNTKTANCVFPSGVVAYENEPFIKQGKLFYKGKYYVCGGETGSLTKDKTENEDYFILTLAAIAKEIEHHGYARNLDVIISAGLPLTLLGSQKDEFKKYLMPMLPVKFEYEEQEYKINIKDVMLFPQGYTAIAYKKNMLLKEPSQILVDIGAWTVDVVLINKGLPVAGKHRSLEMGVMVCIEEILEEIRKQKGLSMTEIQVEQVLLGKDCSMDMDVKFLIKNQAKAYSEKLFKELSKAKFDINAVPTIIMGGGAEVIKPYIQKSQLIELLSDIHANAKGYEILAYAKVNNSY